MRLLQKRDPELSVTYIVVSLEDILKGTMSPQVHAQVDNNNFEIVSPTFSNTVREFRRLFYRIGCKCKGISTDFEKLAIFYRK